MDYSKKPGKKIEKIGEVINKEKPVISIITPFYNGGKTLKETYNSVLSQTYPYFEWIIVDDGSKDKESLKELDKIASSDERIKVFHKENGGPSVARDYAVEKTSEDSKYLFFLDCDDIIDKTMLECLYWALETNKDASFAYTTMVNFGDREFIWEKYITAEIEKRENVICISSMVKKEDFLEVGGFGIKEKAMYEDWNLWLKLLAKGKVPVRLNAPLFWYRISNTGELSRARNNNKKAMEIINATAKTVDDFAKIIQYPKFGKKYVHIKDIDTMTLPSYKNDKKTILFMFPWTVVGGADIFNYELIKRLDHDKYDAIVVTNIPNTNPMRQDFEEYATFYDLSTFLDRKYYLNFIDYLIKSRNIDIVFNSNSAYGYALIPYIKAKYSNVSVIDYIHSVDLKDPRGGFGRFTSEFDDFVDSSYACNNFTTNQLINDFNKSKVETLYIGVDHKRFDPENFDAKELKQKYKIPDNKKVITFIARLSEEKRPELFVKIARELLKKRDDLFFVIAGDGPLKKVVSDKIKKYCLKDIKMLGMINNTEEVYAISDITINCSRLEGLALTSYESLAMGVPIVSSDVGGQTELIDDTVGRIVHYKEVTTSKEKNIELNEYVLKIIEVLDNLDDLKKNSRKKILQGFTLEQMSNKFDNIFDNIKPKKCSISVNFSKRIYEDYLENLFDDYKWFCKLYYEEHYGIFEENEEANSKKEKIKKYFKNYGYKINAFKEMSIIFKFIKICLDILRCIVRLFKNLILFVKYFILSIIYGIKLIIKMIKNLRS